MRFNYLEKETPQKKIFKGSFVVPPGLEPGSVTSSKINTLRYFTFLCYRIVCLFYYFIIDNYIYSRLCTRNTIRPKIL
jgi:hypothetical protein